MHRATLRTWLTLGRALRRHISQGVALPETLLATNLLQKLLPPLIISTPQYTTILSHIPATIRGSALPQP